MSDNSAWTPSLDGGERAEVSLAEARAPFLLMAHPRRWEVVRGKVRPMLGRMFLVPGVSNVAAGPNGSLRIGMAKIHYEGRGWQILPAATLPPSQRYRGSYLSRPAGRADVTLAYWEQCFPGSAALRCDEGLKDEFLDWLMDSGTIPVPPLYVLERLRDEARQEAATLADRAQTVPSAKPMAKAAAERAKVLDAMISGREGERVPSESVPVSVDGADE